MAFCGYLKQSTTVTIQLGPFVDDGDGKTAEEGLTIEDTDIELSKNGGAFAAPNDTNNAAHDSAGYYTKQLNDTDTNTLGILTVECHESGALPVRQDYQVVIAHWYDTMCSTDLLHVDVHAIDDDGAAADNLESACDNYSVTRGLAGTALPAAAADAAGGLPISDAGELDLDTQIGTDIDAILEDTGEIGAAGAGLSNIPWNSDWDAEVESEVDDALGGGTGTALTAIPWNANWDAQVESEVQDAIEANKLDHLVAVADGDDPVDNSIIAKLAASDGDWSGFSAATDSLEAIRDKQTDIEADTNELQTDDIPGLIGALNDPTAAAIVNEWETQSQADPTGFHVNVMEVNGTAQTANDNGADINAILTDTNELQTDNVPGLIAALNDPTAAAIVNEWETQSQADPTGFHVNVMEVGGTAQTANDNGADINAILTDTNELQTDNIPGLIAGLNDPTAAAIADAVLDEPTVGHLGVGTFGVITAEIADILTYTTEIGTAGDGLTDIPWNAAWDAEAQSEVQDALEANDLDHLVQVSAGAEEPTDGSYLDQIMHAGAGQTFDATTDSLEAIRDRGDAAWVTGGGGAAPTADENAAAIWAAADRTLTQSAVAIQATVDGDDIAIQRGDTFSATITGLGDISARTNLWFTVKVQRSDADSASIIQIDENNGLLYLNGAVVAVAGNGSITVDDETAGDITITLAAGETDDLRPQALQYDIQMVTATAVNTLSEGSARVVADVTRAIA